MEIEKEYAILLDIFTNKVAWLICDLQDNKSNLQEVNSLIRKYNDGFINFTNLAESLELILKDKKQ